VETTYFYQITFFSVKKALFADMTIFSIDRASPDRKVLIEKLKKCEIMEE